MRQAGSLGLKRCRLHSRSPSIAHESALSTRRPNHESRHEKHTCPSHALTKTINFVASNYGSQYDSVQLNSTGPAGLAGWQSLFSSGIQSPVPRLQAAGCGLQAPGSRLWALVPLVHAPLPASFMHKPPLAGTPGDKLLSPLSWS